MGRPKPRPRHQFSPSKAKAQQTCYTAIMNLTQCPPNIPITPTMSTCSEEKLAQSPPAAPPPAPPTVCAAATGKKSTRASHGAPTPPAATAAAKNATTTAKPAPPAAPKRICPANAHLDLLSYKLCRKHQNAPFSQKFRAFFKKNRDKTSPYLSCHDRSHLYPVTKQKILAKYQHLLTSFAAIRYPFDTLPVCPQPPAMEAAASRPGHSWARPAPPLPRAAGEALVSIINDRIARKYAPLCRLVAGQIFGAGPARLARACLDPSHHSKLTKSQAHGGASRNLGATSSGRFRIPV